MNDIMTYLDLLFESIEDKCVVLWGAGKTSDILLHFTNVINIKNLIIVDEYKDGIVFNGYKVHGGFDDDLSEVECVIISAYKESQRRDIKAKLSNMNYVGQVIFVYDDKSNPIFEEPYVYQVFQWYYKKKVRTIRAKDSINIGYISSQAELWNLNSFHKTIQKIEKYTFTVLATSNYEDNLYAPEVSIEHNYAFFKSIGVPVKKLSELSGKHNINEWDIFIDQPGELSVLEQNFSIYDLVANFLICYVPYGFKVAYNVQAHFNDKLTNLAWKVFAESEWHLNQFKEHGLINASNVELSGFAKLDPYLDGAVNYNMWKHKDCAKARIIWAPHWSFAHSNWNYGTFDRYYIDLYEYAKCNPDFDWIVKPHQRLYSSIVENGLLSKSQMEEYFNKWCQLPNGKVCDGGDYIEVFKSSDVMITDCGSFLAEYLPSGNPVLHLVTGHEKYNDIGKIIDATYYHCYNFSDLRDYLERILKNKDDPKMVERMEIESYVIRRDIKAGEKMFNIISNSIMI